MNIEEWCKENGYTGPRQVDGKWWAFPEGAVTPVPIKGYELLVNRLSGEQRERLLRALNDCPPTRMQAPQEEFRTQLTHGTSARQFIIDEIAPIAEPSDTLPPNHSH